MTEERAPRSANITWHHGSVDEKTRERAFGHKGATVWFTGLSGSGKSTVSRALEEALVARGVHAYVLDGDNVRHGLNSDLAFSPADRTENIRRVGEVAKLFCEAGVLCLTAFISPYRADRERVRALHPEGHFLEVYVDCPLEVCEARDPKGLYKKARAGEIGLFTGISAPYEAPAAPQFVVDTAQRSIDECVSDLVSHLVGRGLIEP